jgi:galactitol-specific phosphotransferase system IIC component
MADPNRLDETFHIIIERLIATGQAPHYTEIASELGVKPAEGRQALHALFSSRGLPGWLFPKTDNIVSFAPFNNLPTHHRLTIDGEQKWYGQ